MIRKTMLAGLVAVLAVPSLARADGKPPAIPFDDAAFVKAVAIAGRYDLYLSEMVGPFTTNADIKNLAVCIVTENIVACTELEAAAKSVGVDLPTKLDDAHQKQYEAFKDHKKDNRDREFVKEMVRHYTLGVAVFTLASKEATNPAVKEFATKALPGLRKQLETAKSLDK